MKKEKIKKILLVIVLILIVSIVSVYATSSYLFNSNNVYYNKEKSNLESENVQDAIDELYEKADSCFIRNTCPIDMKRVDGLNGEYTCVNPKTPESYIKAINTEGETISTTDHSNELRFIGSNPPNYVKFNNQTWRIIGIFDGKLKIVSNPIGNYSYDTSKNNVNNGYGVNAWNDADLMKLLNPGYGSNSDLKCNTSVSITNGVVNCGDNSDSAYTTGLVNNSLYWNAGSGYCYNYGNYQATNCDFTSSGLSDSASKSMIDTSTWYLGSNAASDDLWGANQIMTASYLYNIERSANTGKQCSNIGYCSDTVTRETTWTGKVGLIYPSDYAYATSGGTTYDRATCLSKQVGNVSNSSTPNWQNTYTDCKNNDWLLNISSWTWSLSPRANSSGSTAVFYVNTAGHVTNTDALYAGSVRPVVYLKSSVKITKGDGTQSNPFELSME